MNNDLGFMNRKDSVFGVPFSVFRFRSFLSVCFFLVSLLSFAQVTSAIDSTSIKIGEQITYYVQVETDPTNLVVFPEGQTFTPLEMIESYPLDTLKKKDKYNLIKKYGLTQFDSGSYTIPRQKIIIGDKTFFTDSLKVEVHNVVVDSTQGLYDIKPLIAVEKSGSDWWKYLLLALLIIGVIAFLLFWFIWRKKPLTEAEEIALLPPYDRAKLALRKLDDSPYLENENLKDYYSELTFIIRKYLDEKVYDKALESTTDELITRLNILKEGNQVDLSIDDIKNLESILKRADKDTIVGHDSKELLEGEWVISEYGFPPITISTPKVLKRTDTPLPEALKDKMKLTAFAFEQKDQLTIATSTTVLALERCNIRLVIQIIL